MNDLQLTVDLVSHGARKVDGFWTIDHRPPIDIRDYRFTWIDRYLDRAFQENVERAQRARLWAESLLHK
jgi:hypothetical protein